MKRPVHKKLSFVCLMVPALWAAASPLSATDFSGLVDKIRPSVVTIYTYDKKGNPVAQGTGFFVSNNGKAVTNQHVIEGFHSGKVVLADGRQYKIEALLSVKPSRDLALLKVRIPKSNPLTRFSSVLKQGQEVVAMGSPEGFESVMSTGNLGGVQELEEYGKVLVITAPISSGSSGSPVFNAKGEVIGVATLVHKEGQNLNFAIPASEVISLIRSGARPELNVPQQAQDDEFDPRAVAAERKTRPPAMLRAFDLNSCGVRVPLFKTPSYEKSVSPVDGFHPKKVFNHEHTYSNTIGKSAIDYLFGACSIPNYKNFYKFIYLSLPHKRIYSFLKDSIPSSMKQEIKAVQPSSRVQLDYMKKTSYRGYLAAFLKFQINLDINEPAWPKLILYRKHIVYGDREYVFTCGRFEGDDNTKICDAFFNGIDIYYEPTHTEFNIKHNPKASLRELKEFKFIKYAIED